MGFATMTIPASQVAASLVLAMKEQRQFSEFLSAYYFSVRKLNYHVQHSIVEICLGAIYCEIRALARIVVTLLVCFRFLHPPNTPYVVCFVVCIYIES